MDQGTLINVLLGAVGLIGTLTGIIWNMVRTEAKEQAEQLKKKVDEDRLREVSANLMLEIHDARDSSEKLVNKLEQRHERELEQMHQRVGEQMRSMEQNILVQLQLVRQVLETKVASK